MANWPTHSRDAIGYGILVVLAISTGVVLLEQVSLSVAWLQAITIMGICGTVMVVFPDTDHPESRPTKYLLSGATVVGVGIATWALIGDPHRQIVAALSPVSGLENPTLIAGVIIVCAIGVGIYGLRILIGWLPHRGPTHGLPGMVFGAALTGGLVFVFLPADPLRPIIVGLGMVVGAGGIMVHRLRDWIS